MRNKRMIWLAPVVAMTALSPVSAAPFTRASARIAADPTAIVIKNFDFSPMTLTVRAGATVTWKNTDGEPHTVTSTDGLFRSGALDQADSFKFTFAKPGTYKYVCPIHPKMLAAIVVK